jgi:hypothetical protein
MGELEGEREYDSTRDWSEIEALSRAEAKAADKEAEAAVSEAKKASVYIKRAKTSQKVLWRVDTCRWPHVSSSFARSKSALMTARTYVHVYSHNV